MRYFVGFLIFVALIITGFTVFHHVGGSTPAPVPINLPSYANTSTVVQFTIDGPVVYDANHNEIRITVGQYQNSINVIQGYQGTVISSNTYPNNEPAYNEFLTALQIAGFTKSQKFPYSSTGACATGERYYLSVIDDTGTTLQNLWSTSDCGSEGTFAGVIGPIINLFEAQIPNYGSDTDNVDL